MKFTTLLIALYSLLLLSTPMLSAKSLKASEGSRQGDIKLNKTWRVVNNLATSISYKDNRIDWTNDQVLEFKEKVVSDIKFIYGKAKIADSTAMFIAFRGTDNGRNWVRNLNGVTKNDFEGAKVHSGFKGAYDKTDSALEEEIVDYLTKNKDLSHVVFAGHSLGGALSTMACLKMTKIFKEKFPDRKLKYYLISFGSPRVGNKDFADKVNSIENLIINVRYTYGNDIVPKVPVGGFIHVGAVFHFTSSEAYDEVKCKDTTAEQESDCEEVKKTDDKQRKLRESAGGKTKSKGAVKSMASKIAGMITCPVQNFASYLSSIPADHSEYKNIKPAILGSTLKKFIETCKSR